MPNVRQDYLPALTFCGVCEKHLMPGEHHDCIVKSPLEVKLEQAEARLRALEQRSARQDAQIAELTRRLDAQEAGK